MDRKKQEHKNGNTTKVQVKNHVADILIRPTTHRER